jgi:anaerobic C4-dicarboxylate transporter
MTLFTLHLNTTNKYKHLINASISYIIILIFFHLLMINTKINIGNVLQGSLFNNDFLSVVINFAIAYLFYQLIITELIEIN